MKCVSAKSPGSQGGQGRSSRASTLALSGLALTVVLAVLVPSSAKAAAASIQIGAVAGPAGTSVQLPATLTTDQPIAALQLDLTYDPVKVTPGLVTLGAAATDHIVDSAVVSTGRLRVVVYSPTNAALVSGGLVTIGFAIAPGAAQGVTPVDLPALLFSSAGGQQIATTGALSGSITVQPPVALPADLAITKSGSATSNGTIQFTVTASNAGPNTATGASLLDTLPPEVATASWSCVASGGASCPTGPFTGNLNVLVNLPSGSQVAFTMAGTLTQAAGSQTINTAQVVASSANNDSNPANNIAQVTVPIPEQVLFADGFESGGTSQWSSTSGGLAELRVSFSMPPEVPAGSLLEGVGAAGALFRIESSSAGKWIRIRSEVPESTGSQHVSDWIPVLSGARITVHWWSERPPGAHNGGFRLWVGDALVVDLTGMHNGGEEVLGLASPSRRAGLVSPESSDSLLVDYAVEEVEP